jgi:hypothetical protein
MLSDRQSQLLTAYVDGELDAPQRQAVDHLLTSSPEARALVNKLVRDSKELRNLPAQPAPSTLAMAVMQNLSDTHQVMPQQVVARPPDHQVMAQSPDRAMIAAGTIPRGIGFAAAACVLATVGIGTFWLAGLVIKEKPQDATGIAAVAEPNRTVRLDFAQLQETPVKERLTSELKKLPGFWFDLPATNTQGAVDRFTAAFKTTGITVLVDREALACLTKNLPMIKYIVYAENVTHDEAADIFQQVAIAEQKSPAKALGMLEMTEFNAKKRTELASAMRVEPQLLDPTTAKMFELPAFIEAPNNLSAKPAAAPKRPERFAVLLTMNGEGDPAASPELRQFLAARQSLRPGTVQIVLVIREQGA